jgi:hypothetical protein
MSLYRRVARSKKGMSTIFGGLFFVIIILMGFNVMLWGFIQYDAYNHVITSMSQRDQQATSEYLVPVNSTCSSSCSTGSGTLSIIVNNLGGYSVSIANVYIYNTNNTGVCSPIPCIASPTGTSGNIPAGATNFLISVSPGVPIVSSNSYHITLATSRGRLFNLYYPWRFSSLIINNNGGQGQFVTNIGPLAIYFDDKSFNYTQGTMTSSLSAFCMPSANSIFFIKVQNTAFGAGNSVTLLPQTAMKLELYGSNSPGLNVLAFIAANNTLNPAVPTNNAYVLGPTTSYVLQPSGISGPTPASFAIVKFGPGSQGGTGSISFPSKTGNFLTFIGIYYIFQGQPQGETIPFMDFDNTQSTSNPTCLT